MALFNKIFSSNKRKNVNANTTSHSASQFPFNNEQVRVLLYRECDWRGRRLLFDSSAVQRVQISQNCRETKNFIETCDGYGYKYARPNPDSGNLGEMVFGSVAMSFRGTALKVHWLQSPTKLLCSQVFLSPVRTNTFSNASDLNNTGSDISSVDTSSVNSFSLSVSVCVPDNLNKLGDKLTSSNPLDVPPAVTPLSSSSLSQQSEISIENNSRYMACSAGDSGYSGTEPWNFSACYPSNRSSFGSMYSDQENIRKMSVDSVTGEISNGNSNQMSDGNIHRRILKNLSTSFENKNSMSDFIGYVSDNFNSNSDVYVSRRRNSEIGVENHNHRSSTDLNKRLKASDTVIHYNSCPGSQNTNKNNIRRAKLGLAICITLSDSMEQDMSVFCSEHIALLESMLCRLRAIAEKAYINRQNFYQIMLRGWHTTAIWISDLFKAPRIINPIWLTLSCGDSKNPDILAQKFMSELCWLLNSADTKDTNFFISTLVTAILTNHLGWVGTVAPLISSTNLTAANQTKTSSKSSKTLTSSSSPSINTIRAKISDISKSHPYSALWAQIGDLYGSIGNPPKISKTIICGRETQMLDKILNVLTYFIRCGEIKREFKDKIIEKDLIENIMENINENCLQNENINVTTPDDNEELQLQSELNNNNMNYNKINGMLRTSTCIKDLSILVNQSDNSDNSSISSSSSSPCDDNEILNDHQVNDLIKIFKKNVMNDIPNVLAYRDSRFIKQELRIGNFLMDTGIEMNEKLKSDIKNYHIKNNTLENIKLTLTNPDNIELNLIDNCGINNHNEFKRSKSLYTKSRNSSKRNSIYMKKSKNDGGYSTKITKGDEKDARNSAPTLSELLTMNSLGCGDRLLWNVSPMHQETKSNNPSGVVFVLGDDEELVDLKCNKKLPPSSSLGSNGLLNNNQIKLSACSLECVNKDNNENNNIEHHQSSQHNLLESQFHKSISSISMDTSNIIKSTSSMDHLHNHQISNSNNEQKLCKHKYKKHSGVKFNFEQYPQIATNYMKNKNLDISNYNFLEKGLKIEKEIRLNNGSDASTSTLTVPGSSSSSSSADALALTINSNNNLTEFDEECECCRMGGNGSHYFLTTPSNASELEFSCDLTENNYKTNTSSSDILTTPTNASELEYSCDNETQSDRLTTTVSKTIGDLNDNRKTTVSSAFPVIIKSTSSSSSLAIDEVDTNVISKIKIRKSNSNNLNIDDDHNFIRPKINDNNQIKIVCIPMPKSKPRVKEKLSGDVNRSLLIFNPGFIPSLLIGVSDHYIPDMVLQGTSSPPTKWESSLKNDLVLSSHCCILEQTPIENVAIIGNIDKWDVRLVSSQTFVLPSGACSGGPVGMSQLVASMLETVHAMWGAGTSAYHCMSYIESKLQEMYFQSETLATFLLDTEFCSLNKLTSALNLSANDVPLLLSVASVHSPQVTKKYGVSFR